ncbi:MAG: hypothetical protein UV78_C0028G0011 [Parcubacteria group bacterium GW2011_GWA2_43_17]|nr:MAG: hypothetical protein UV78_C0028G0011 [Parcubacteria group bacterium GW2011_GWA2_43_17]KKT94476.1 MAG: hypothetical protein UW91_C0001G0040 [Parcubacteria group bacterium GW2011_GWF2_45_11]KKT96885.1 MAG: hypothetical protein UW98_C0032G0012 [Parcubacteria group bacterium GW2011_GWC2_45_15]OGY93783.1 MAG: hypothetical protein A3J95_01815 [Candidatus Komeilibacteria bacterium RIFOXYC2_FULL_45_12]OGY94120.1 MAG: hypothetical protein A2260_03795 [Candidatus Komeilibacteria bacterium RIFOXYA
MKYNKLVRDNIPEIIKKKGGRPLTHCAGDREYWIMLKEKLAEEVKEFVNHPVMEELADIQEVLEAISHYKKFDLKKLSKIKKAKAKSNGRFTKKIILDES